MAGKKTMRAVAATVLGIEWAAAVCTDTATPGDSPEPAQCNLTAAYRSTLDVQCDVCQYEMTEGDCLAVSNQACDWSIVHGCRAANRITSFSSLLSGSRFDDKINDLIEIGSACAAELNKTGCWGQSNCMWDAGSHNESADFLSVLLAGGQHAECRMDPSLGIASIISFVDGSDNADMDAIRYSAGLCRAICDPMDTNNTCAQYKSWKDSADSEDPPQTDPCAIYSDDFTAREWPTAVDATFPCSLEDEDGRHFCQLNTEALLMLKLRDLYPNVANETGLGKYYISDSYKCGIQSSRVDCVAANASLSLGFCKWEGSDDYDGDCELDGTPHFDEDDNMGHFYAEGDDVVDAMKGRCEAIENQTECELSHINGGDLCKWEQEGEGGQCEFGSESDFGEISVLFDLSADETFDEVVDFLAAWETCYWRGVDGTHDSCVADNAGDTRCVYTTRIDSATGDAEGAYECIPHLGDVFTFAVWDRPVCIAEVAEVLHAASTCQLHLSQQTCESTEIDRSFTCQWQCGACMPTEAYFNHVEDEYVPSNPACNNTESDSQSGSESGEASESGSESDESSDPSMGTISHTSLYAAAITATVAVAFV